MKVLLEVAEGKVTLITTVINLQTSPLKEEKLVIMNTNPAMMAAESFSKSATELAGALVLVRTSDNVQGRCVGFHRCELQAQRWPCLATGRLVLNNAFCM